MTAYGIAGQSEFAALERAVQEARLRVVVAAVYPLDEAAQDTPRSSGDM